MIYLVLVPKKNTHEEILNTITVQNQGVSNAAVAFITFNVFPYCINNMLLIYQFSRKDGDVQRLDNSVQHF